MATPSDTPYIVVPSLNHLKDVIKAKGYKIYGGDSKPYHLNIGGIRNVSLNSNTFDDAIYVFFDDENGVSKYYVTRATTDPGRYWLTNPMCVDGTRILALGQYTGCFKLGMHRGEYEALVQCGNMKFHVDNDRDDNAEPTAKIQTGIIGCNLHRANPNPLTPSTNVDKWSAACQVVAGATPFNNIIAWVKESLKYRDNLFSYTLLHVTDFK